MRLKWTAQTMERVEFFHTKTIDYLNLGFVHSKMGASCGIPLTYLAENGDAVKSLYPRGIYIFGNRYPWNEIEAKLGDRTQQFLNTLVLSEQAKNFAVLRELNESKFPKELLKIFSDILCYGWAYSYCFAKNRKLKFNISSGARYSIYTKSILIATLATITLRYLLNLWSQNRKDSKTMDLGIDMCDGGIEYYTKLIERNRLLRDFVENGNELIDENGELKKKSIVLPLMNKLFYVNNYERSLNAMRERCKAKLNFYVQKPELASAGTAAKEDKELSFFKDLRESIKKAQNK